MLGEKIIITSSNRIEIEKALQSLIGHKDKLVEMTKHYPVICSFDAYSFIVASESDIVELIETITNKLNER